jgi:hypothetical protein
MEKQEGAKTRQRESPSSKTQQSLKTKDLEGERRQGSGGPFLACCPFFLLAEALHDALNSEQRPRLFWSVVLITAFPPPRWIFSPRGIMCVCVVANRNIKKRKKYARK